MRKIVFIIFLFISTTAVAAIHKEAIICEETKSLCLYAWPELPNISGWQQDKDSSIYYSANTLAPTGEAFSEAESVIYAKAELRGEIKNLEEFIGNDHKNSLTENPTLKIKEEKPAINSNGVKFKSYSFTPQKEGNWEIVNYTEETDRDGNQYYLIFTLSSRTEKGFNASRKAYEKMLNLYKP